MDTNTTIAERSPGFSVLKATTFDPRKSRGPFFNAVSARDLKLVLHSTVHGQARLSVEEIAHELGISPTYLYRAVLPGESGCRFPLDLLVPLVSITNDKAVVDHINRQCGRIAIDKPLGEHLRLTDPHVITEMSQHFHALMGAALAFFERPESSQFLGIRKRLHELLGELATLGNALETAAQKEAL